MSDTPGWTRPDDSEPATTPATPPAPPPEAPAAPVSPPTSPPTPPPPAAPPPQAAPVPSGWSAVQPPPAPGWYDQPGQPAQPDQPGQPGLWGRPTQPGQPGQPGQQPGWAGWVSQRPPEVKPGVIPLRPLGVGEILDGAITTMRRHWKIMLGLSAAVVAVTSSLQFAALYLFLRDVTALESLEQAPTVADAAGLLAGSVSAFAVALIFGLIAQLVLQGVLTVVVSRAVLGEQISLGEAWSRARGRLLPLLGLSLLLVVLFAGVLLAGLVPGLLGLAAGLAGPAVAALFVLGVLAAVPMVIHLYVRYALSAAALVLERQPVRAALGRSSRLVRGSWWRVFGILLLATIIAAVIGQIISIPFNFASLLTYDAGNPNTVPGLAYFVLNTLGASIAGTITYPFSAGVAVLLYVDLRMRREALDLELARAAGVTLPGSPAPSNTPPS